MQMGILDHNLGLGLADLGAQVKPLAIESIVAQEARLMKIIEPPSAITTIMEQEAQMRAFVEPPSALTAIIERENHLCSMLSSPIIEAVNAQQDYLEKHELAFSKAIEASLQIPNLDWLSESVAQSTAFALQERTYDLASAMGHALEACIPKYDMMVDNLSCALEAAIPQFDMIGEMAIKFTNAIPQIDHAVSSLAQQSINALDIISASMQSSISALIDSLANIRIPNFDHISNSLNFISDFEEKNELLKSFGWYLISELPEEIVDAIYERRDEITQEEVDTLIVQHFRSDKCHALKCIVKSWTSLPYFESREDVFHQAQVCHSRRIYNASTSLISLHYEGVVTDFVRYRIDTPTYRVEKALKCINDLTNDLTMDAMPFKDWIVCSYVLECVDQVFTTNFSPSDPDSCPNTSRHKIAHGHATAKETEANSLRRFLFMNELYKLFRCLENEYQLVS